MMTLSGNTLIYTNLFMHPTPSSINNLFYFLATNYIKHARALTSSSRYMTVYFIGTCIFKFISALKCAILLLTGNDDMDSWEDASIFVEPIQNKLIVAFDILYLKASFLQLYNSNLSTPIILIRENNQV